MKPTIKLRYVERDTDRDGNWRRTRYLQQWWCGFTDEHETDIKGEWRDVELEKEE